MNIATFILVYAIAWWMVFFAALPFGVKAQHESDEEQVPGTADSAPVNPNLKKKALITSVIALVLTIAYYFLATSELISFRIT
jgi:predicted secreted protein